MTKRQIQTLVITGIILAIVFITGAVIWINANQQPKTTFSSGQQVQTSTNSLPSILALSGVNENDTITKSIVIRPQLKNSSDVVRAELYVDGNFAGVSYAYPFELTFSIGGYADGQHKITVKIFDKAGKSYESNTLEITLANPANTTTDTSSTITPTSSKQTYVGTPTIYAPLGDKTPPTTPANLLVVVNQDSTTRAVISWGASTDASGINRYEIYRDGVLLQTTTLLTYTDRTIVPGYVYSYSVRSVDQSGNFSSTTPSVTAQPAAATLFATTDTPPSVTTDPTPVELGIRFRAHAPGALNGARFYKAAGSTGPYTINLWNDSGTNIGSATLTGETASGWQYVSFASPITLYTGQIYTISYSLPNGYYSYTSNGLASIIASQYLSSVAYGDGAGNGVYNNTPGSYPTSSFNSTNYWIDPVFTPGQTVGNELAITKQDNSTIYSGYPGSNNTGVLAGSELDIFNAKTIFSTGNITINNKIVYGQVILTGTAQVTITNSKIFGNVEIDSSTASLSITDSTIDADTYRNAAIGFRNFTLERVNALGGTTSVNCATNCTIKDSWLHGQYLTPASSDHLGGFLSNGGPTIDIAHNSIGCDVPDNGAGGGCSGSLQLYGDFATNQDVTVNNNLMLATYGAYCTSFGYNPGKTYGSNPTNIIVTNNIWQRGTSGFCGQISPTTSYLNANGNQWMNNKYDDGAIVNP